MSLPLALIHGWGQHGGIWRELLSRLPADSALNALNLELPGHGDAAPGSFDIDTLVDRYAAQAPATCTLVAWSLGGMLALRWAQRHPQQVKKLVLFSTTPCFGVRTDWPYGSPAEVQQAFAALVAADPESALQRFADLLAVGEGDQRNVRRSLRARVAEKHCPEPEPLLAGLDFLRETDLRNSLLQAPPLQPILIVHGEGDTITPFDAGRWLASALPQARLHAIPQCGHAPMLSHVEAVVPVVEAFINE